MDALRLRRPAAKQLLLLKHGHHMKSPPRGTATVADSKGAAQSETESTAAASSTAEAETKAEGKDDSKDDVMNGMVQGMRTCFELIHEEVIFLSRLLACPCDT